MGTLRDVLNDMIPLGTAGDALVVNGTEDGVEWAAGGGGGGGAPTTADYLVKTANAGLSAERVVTDTPSITVDWGTAGQAKIQREALTGDVTAAQNSNATTIAANAVTNAKMATMPALTVKLNATGGAAVPTDETMATLAGLLAGLVTPADASKVLSSGTSTIAANTCRYITRRFTIASGAHLVIASGGSFQIGA